MCSFCTVGIYNYSYSVHQFAKKYVFPLTFSLSHDIVIKRHGSRSFFLCLKTGRREPRAQKKKSVATTQINTVEVEVVRVRITLACTECKQRNYNMTKEKKNHPERLETKKYCKFCKRHTMHKETK